MALFFPEGGQGMASCSVGAPKKHP